MFDLLFLVPLLPLAGFLILALGGERLERLGRGPASWIGVGSVGLSFAVALGLAVRCFTAPPEGDRVVQTLWTWISIGDFTPEIGLVLDPLSLVMILIVTGVGFLIHLYSTDFMAHEVEVRAEGGYSRYFAYLNLFVGSMLLLVLASDLLLLYLGWEGVGLCSYLLIGFWYRDPANGRAARKAFLVTRVGDTALALGLFLLATRLGTLEIGDVLTRATETWPVGSALAVAASALLLGGAVGKSAQLPLQTWLPDAMAGPTPVSALIHAATMVTAGVYLVARTHELFLLAPPVLTAVAVVGAVTLLVAGFAALAQRDVKRILAYSTISQIGYMFLGLGVGAFSAGIFHLMTHAFFKALLFLGAGVLILALDHEHDVYEMGGLRKKMPTTFWTFLAGAAALAGFPLVTAGFYSKDLILWKAWSSPQGSVWLWALGALGALVTALYAFRMVFLIFFGREGKAPSGRPGWRMALPLLILALLSLVSGIVELPPTLGDSPFLSHFLAGTFGETPHGESSLATEALFQVLSGLISLAGIGLAWLWFGPARRGAPTSETLRRWARAGFGFDRLYDLALVRPFVALGRVLAADPLDRPFRGLAAWMKRGHGWIAETQTGSLRDYALSLVLGAVVFLGLVLWILQGVLS